MNKSPRSWWLLFSAGTVLVLLTLSWVSIVVLQLEHRERVARADANHQESLRLALWRMDSWLAPQLARESVRPYFEYESFYRPQLTIAPGSRRLDTEQLKAPSPLLGFDNVLITPHMASFAQEATERSRGFAIYNADRVAKGQEPESAVPPDGLA